MRLQPGDVKIVGRGSEREHEVCIGECAAGAERQRMGAFVAPDDFIGEQAYRLAADNIAERYQDGGDKRLVAHILGGNGGDFVECGRVQMMVMAINEYDVVSRIAKKRVLRERERGADAAESRARDDDVFRLWRVGHIDDMIPQMRYDRTDMKGSMSLLEDTPITKGTRVIVRADLDVGVKNGKIADDFRLRAALPTLRYLLRRGAHIRMIGYLGRPQGKRDETLTLGPVARRLHALLGRKVVLVRDPFGQEAMRQYGQSPDILLFENIRFWHEEISNDSSFARRIARWGDCYVNDAFANSHRREASLVAVPKLLPSYAGLRLAAEMAALARVMEHPARPMVAVLGGAKIETKLPLLRRFLRDADRVLVGGALANTLFAAQGKNIGKSLAEEVSGNARLILQNKKLVLPSDVLTAPALRTGSPRRVRTVDDVRADEYIADIGPASRTLFAGIISDAKTIVWNGPMGYAEVSAFAGGTAAVADALRVSRGFTVVGGGDTLAVLARHHGTDGFSHVSTGGGAMLAVLAGKKLPGLEALKKSHVKHQK